MMEPTSAYTPSPTRYDTMTYNRCGSSGLKLPAISLGCWHNFGDHTPFETMRQLTRTAFDHGITHFDLANNYGPEPGSAERTTTIIKGVGEQPQVLTRPRNWTSAWIGTPLHLTWPAARRCTWDCRTTTGRRWRRPPPSSELQVPFIINQNRYNIFDRTVEPTGSRRPRSDLLPARPCYPRPEQHRGHDAGRDGAGMAAA